MEIIVVVIIKILGKRIDIIICASRNVATVIVNIGMIFRSPIGNNIHLHGKNIKMWGYKMKSLSGAKIIPLSQEYPTEEYVHDEKMALFRNDYGGFVLYLSHN